MDIRRQAKEALQQAQAEIIEAEQAAANAHQQVLGEPMLLPVAMLLGTSHSVIAMH